LGSIPIGSTFVTRDASTLLADLEARLRPLYVELNRAWWEANVASSAANEARRRDAELALREALGDPDAYAAVGAARATVPPGSAEHRQLDLLWREMTPHQIDPARRRRLVELETRVEAIFNTHRGEIDGERVDDNRIAEILRTSADAALRRAAWEASKTVGAEAAPLVLELVKLRNDAARDLGFRDHYQMALTLAELDERRLAATLDEVDALTAGPFRQWKAAYDAELAARFGCAPEELRPWHLGDPFFQEPPPVEDVDLDAHFADRDLVALTLATFDGIGIDLRPVLARSDLHGRDGKSQHAFCIDIDRAGDVRVLANVVPNERWAETMLHEFGHAAYDVGIDPALPFLLHGPAHMAVTEAVAMMFGALVREPLWLATVGGMPADKVSEVTPALAEGRRAAGLVMARWMLVMCRFERDLYLSPDADHGRRWWDLVESLQRVHRPEGPRPTDWAAKIHLAVAPVYYQNYLLGELVAAQLRHHIDAVLGGLVGNPAVGTYLVEAVFAHGMRHRWDRLLERATGEPLTARPFAATLA
jgi:peptidyl-dipeptidase A